MNLEELADKMNTDVRGIFVRAWLYAGRPAGMTAAFHRWEQDHSKVPHYVVDYADYRNRIHAREGP